MSDEAKARRDFTVMLGAIDIGAESLEEAVKVAAEIVGTNITGGIWVWFVKEWAGRSRGPMDVDWESQGWTRIETGAEA